LTCASSFAVRTGVSVGRWLATDGQGVSPRRPACFAVGDRAADLGGNLLVEQRGVVAVDLDI
jgi:hypothetical protein